MRHLTRINIAIAALLVCILVSAPSATASQQSYGFCSMASLGGTWGYTESGTIILPTGAVPFVAVGRVYFDQAGNLSGTQDSSLGGKASHDVVRGTFTIDRDCTGTMTVGVYDPAGNLLRALGLAFVVDDNATETRAVITSLVLPNAASLPAVITLEAKRLNPKNNMVHHIASND